MKKAQLQKLLRGAGFALLALTVACASFFAADLFIGRLQEPAPSAGIPPVPETLRAMTIRTGPGGDFPSEPNLPVKVQQEELDKIVAFAEVYGYNTLFFEAVAGADAVYRSSLLPASASWMGEEGRFSFFDPLDYLTEAAGRAGIGVYAVVNPYRVSAGSKEESPARKNPDWLLSNEALNPALPDVQKLTANVIRELTEKYAISGVLISGVDSDQFDQVPDYAGVLAETVRQSSEAIHTPDRQRLGIVVSGNPQSGGRDLFSEPLRSKTVSFVVPAALSDPLQAGDSLVAELAAWQELCAQTDTAYYPLHRVSDETAFTHAADNSIYFERQYGAGGQVISSYGTLATPQRTAAYTLAATFSQAWPEPLKEAAAYPQSLSVTRPTDVISVHPTWSTYYIMGTSDPAQPLYYNDKELERDSETGLWGAFVNVDYGKNTYRFSQGDTVKTVTINRPQETASSVISTITRSSAYPGNPEVVLWGGVLNLSCTAPSGGTVTASIGGLTAELLPVSTAQEGVAVTYKGTLDLSSLAVAEQVTNLGPVTYKLGMDGMNSFQESAGSVYVCGAGATPVATMPRFASTVNQNPADDGSYVTILRKGCTDVITENVGGYYKLSLGGYILKSAVEIPDGKVSAVTQVRSVTLSDTGKGEQLVIGGSAHPAFVGTLTDEGLTVKLQNISGWDNINLSALTSRLCQSIRSSAGNDGSVTIDFILKDGVRLLGWDVLTDEDSTRIYLKEFPSLQLNTAKPLTGVSIALDPGHGGDDSGALGVPGLLGPAENILNMADSRSLQSRLEALGATVKLMHQNETMTMDDRMALAQKMDADFFISSHHNSLSESADSGSAAGIEVYYWNDASAGFADRIGQNLSEQTGRRLRFTEQSWYRVTMTMACPAVLVESGFLCNPAEYEGLNSDYGMYRYGNAVADAVLQYLSFL